MSRDFCFSEGALQSDTSMQVRDMNPNFPGPASIDATIPQPNAEDKARATAEIATGQVSKRSYSPLFFIGAALLALFVLSRIQRKIAQSGG